MGLRPSPEVGTGRGALPSPPGSSARRGCSTQYPILRGRLLLRAFIPWTVAWSLPSGRRPVRAAAPHLRPAGLVPRLTICLDQLRARPGVGARGPGTDERRRGIHDVRPGGYWWRYWLRRPGTRPSRSSPGGGRLPRRLPRGPPRFGPLPLSRRCGDRCDGRSSHYASWREDDAARNIGRESPGQRGHPWLPGTSATGGCSCPSA